VTLSNCLNSDLRRVFVLTQYKALSLNRHVRRGWSVLMGLGEFIEVLPPQMRVSQHWYLGTADAVYQNIYSIGSEQSNYVFILSGDHIYKMNYQKMLDQHIAAGADVTVATLEIDAEEAARRFGVIETDRDWRIVGFEEKPSHSHPARSVFNPDMLSASMGVYVFNTDVLLRVLRQDARNPDSSHDFGRDVLPAVLGNARVVAYDFRDINDKQARYWRDVGTIDAFYEANLDLVAVTPEFNLYDNKWPIRTRVVQAPPAKFVFAQEGRRMGVAIDSIVCAGCIVSGGRVVRSVLATGVRVNSYCEVEYSILMPNVEVGRNSRIRRAIVDSGVHIPESTVIGYDLEQDRASGYHVTDSGIVVVPAGGA